LDGALLRPGRFELLIEIPAPDAADRKAILQVYDKKMALGLHDRLLDMIVKRTEGYADRRNHVPFSGDHLYAICRALKRISLREGGRAFTEDDVVKAMTRKMSKKPVLSKHEQRVIAVHEAGHALLSMLIPKARPPEKITIDSDTEGALGYVQKVASANPYAVTSEEMRAEIAVGLGGIEAERLVFGDVSVGAYQDLQNCTSIARAMVAGHGMVEGLVARVVLDDEHTRDQLSQERWAQIDRAIDEVLRRETERARHTLGENRPLLDALVALLLEHKVLDATAIQSVHDKSKGAPPSA
jgi:cell division protease FtsH